MSDEVKWSGEAFEKEVDRAVQKTLRSLADRFVRIIQELFRDPKHGRIYGAIGAIRALQRFAGGLRKTRPGGVHQASAPGEAPAIDTAALSKSVTYDIAKVDDEWAVEIGPSMQSGRAKIAGYLEFGTSRIKPRPAWRQALQLLLSEGERAAAKESEHASSQSGTGE